MHQALSIFSPNLFPDSLDFSRPLGFDFSTPVFLSLIWCPLHHNFPRFFDRGFGSDIVSTKRKHLNSLLRSILLSLRNERISKASANFVKDRRRNSIGSCTNFYGMINKENFNRAFQYNSRRFDR